MRVKASLSPSSTLRTGGVATLLCALGGCLSVGGSLPDEPTIEDLLAAGEQPGIVFEPRATALPAESVPGLMGQYEAALAVTQEQATRRGIQRRLAGLEMRRSEQLEAGQETGQASFSGPIMRYRALLERGHASASDDQLLYQLARAYDMDGQFDRALTTLDRLVIQHPNSPLFVEAQFRRGEMLFSQQRYAAAESAYADVAAGGEGSSFYLNAVYLYGWSQFKQGLYLHSLDAFSQIMDVKVPAAGGLDALGRADLEMVLDTLRAMSLVFAHEGGAVVIERRFASAQRRRYLPLLYRALADLHLEQGHYLDTAETYTHFIERHGESVLAPSFSVRVVDAYARGGYRERAIVAQQRYVQRYGVEGGYWAAAAADLRAQLRPQLRDYFDQLARYEHARGLAFKSRGQAAHAEDSLLRAAGHYQQFVATVPDDEQVPAMTFLLGEALFEAAAYHAEHYQAAIQAYEWVAYQRHDTQRGAKAGYAAVLAYDALLATTAASASEPLHRQKMRSALRFAERYPEHPQANAVLVQGAAQSLQRRHYAEAIAVARRVTEGQGASQAQLGEAWQVQGQAHFAQADYARAQSAFAAALPLMVGAERREAVADRLAASVYRRGEEALERGEQSVAIAHFLRVADVAPRSAIAAQGQYDAAAHLIERQAWGEAEQVLTTLRTRYGAQPIAQNLADKLAEVYLQQGKWPLAAAELSRLAQRAPKAEQRRQALYRAAELYRTSEQPAQAITHFRRYLERYPRPFDDAVEARVQLTELTRVLGRLDARQYWLQQLVVSHDRAGAQGTERSLFLAAQAATALAEGHYQAFQRAQLALPLAHSLRLKRASLDAALRAYEKVLDYRVAQFFSLANYRIADVYAILSRDLLTSQRPVELSERELEQYELLLEEQAYPFEEQAIALHESNAKRASEGRYDAWVRRSFSDLAVMMPARYDKSEKTVDYSDELH